MFIKEDGTTINNNKQISNKKNSFLKIAAMTFEAGDFLNIFLRFWVF